MPHVNIWDEFIEVLVELVRAQHVCLFCAKNISSEGITGPTTVATSRGNIFLQALT